MRAHSIRRSADLRTIARKGHVSQVTVDMNILMKTGGKPAQRLIGINEASTFTGFCALHDARTFAPLETVDFSATSEQCFLLFYRAWARETYTKEGALRSLPVLRDMDKGKPVGAQRGIQAFVGMYAQAVSAGMTDVLAYKAKLDAAYLAGAYGTVISHVFWFQSELPVLCSGAFYPYYDLAGNELQKFEPGVLSAPLALTLLNDRGSGCAVLSWLAGHEQAPMAFLESLKNEASVADALCRTAYSCLENVYCDPDWWDGLTPTQHSEIVERVRHGSHPTTDYARNFLRARGEPFLSHAIATSIAV